MNANVQQVSGNSLITAVCILGLEPVGVVRCICLSLLNWLICSSSSVVVVRFNAFPIVVYSVYDVVAPTLLQNLGQTFSACKLPVLIYFVRRLLEL